MMPLILDDLLPLPEYAARRREFFNSLGRYLDRYRRVRIGPKATLVFENRQTLWFRVHEIIRVARLADAERLQQELDWYNTLLPGRDVLQAALLIDVDNETRFVEELVAFKELTGEQLLLRAGKNSQAAALVTCRPEDFCIGAAHWVQFHLDDQVRKFFADFAEPAYLEITLPSYQYQSAPLSDEIRQSLLEDLELSDKDG